MILIISTRATNRIRDRDGVAGGGGFLCKDGSMILAGSNLANTPVGPLTPRGTTTYGSGTGASSDLTPVEPVKIIDISNDDEEDAMIKLKKNCSLTQQ